MAPVLDRLPQGVVRRPGYSPGEPARVRAPQGEAVALLQAHRRHRVQVRLHGQSMG